MLPGKKKKPKSKKSCDHVVAISREGYNAMECRHCGEKLVYELPLRLDTWIELANGFVRIHSKCPAPVSDSGGGIQSPGISLGEATPAG